MVTENAEETKEQNKTNRKASSPKPKLFAYFSSVVDTSCTKLNELFSCQKVAHSLIFYIIIFVLLLLLLYIFRKLVSLPSSNGKYHDRKHNGTASAGSHNSSNDSLSRGFPIKWPNLDTILKKAPTYVLGSTALTSAKEKKARKYGAAGSDLQKKQQLSYHENINNVGENAYDNRYNSNKEFKFNSPIIESYSSTFNRNVPKITQENVNEQILNKLQTADWGAPNSFGRNEYGKNSSDRLTLKILSSNGFTSDQNGWSSRDYIGNSGFKPSDSNWESWTSVPWDINSNLRSWSYFGSSGSGHQDARSNYRSIPNLTPNANNYGMWDLTNWSRGKWGQPENGFGWIKTDKDKEDSYKSTTTPNWSNHYYDNASGKRRYNKDEYINKNDPSPANLERSNRYRTYNAVSHPYSSNPYAEYWGTNKTQEWDNFNSPSINIAAGINDKTRWEDNPWNHETAFTNNAASENIKPFYQVSSFTEQDDNDERIHRWPLEESHEEKPPKQLSNELIFRGRKNSKISSKRQRIRNKIRMFQRKQKEKGYKKYHKKSAKKHRKRVKTNNSNNYVKKSVIPLAAHLKSKKKKGKNKNKVTMSKIKKSAGKQFLRKVDHQQKQLLRTGRKKIAHQSFITTSHNTRLHKNMKIGDKQNDWLGKWHRNVHHVKKCKKLKSFTANGEVHLVRKYLNKQRKYKYTVLSCRYIRIQNRLKKHRRHLDNEDDDSLDQEIDEDNDDDDDDDNEISLKRKKICRKIWFITNGKISLKKTAKNYDQISYKVQLCRAGVENTLKHIKIKIGNHNHQTAPSLRNDDDYHILNKIHTDKIITHKEEMQNYIDNTKTDNIIGSQDNLDDVNAVINQEDKSDGDRTAKQAKHGAHNKAKDNNNDDIYVKDTREDVDNGKGGDNENDETTNKNTKKSNYDNDDDNNDIDREIDDDTEDDIDIEGNGEQTDSVRSNKRISSSNKKSKARKRKQHNNADDLDGEDIDEIDDIDDIDTDNIDIEGNSEQTDSPKNIVGDDDDNNHLKDANDKRKIVENENREHDDSDNGLYDRRRTKPVNTLEAIRNNRHSSSSNKKSKASKRKQHNNADDLDGENIDEIDDIDDIDTDNIDIEGNSEQTDSPKNIVGDDDDNNHLKDANDKRKIVENENREHDDSDNGLYDRRRTKPVNTLEAIRNNRHSSSSNKKSKASKRKQHSNADDLDGEDIDDIDDIDDTDDSNNNINFDKQEGSKRKANDDLHDNSDDRLDNDDELDDYFDDDIDNEDVMEVDHSTASYRKQKISPMLSKAIKGRIKPKSIKHKMSNTQPKKVNKNIYERLLHELTTEKDTNDKSNDRKNLLTAILKKKLDSTRTPKHEKSKISQGKSPQITTRNNIVTGKEQNLFVPDKGKTNTNIKAVLKDMLTNSIDIKSLSQVIKTQTTKNWRLQNQRKQKKPHIVKPKPFMRPSMNDLLKEILPNTLSLPKPTKPTPPTQQQTEPSTTPDQQNSILFANLLKKFSIQRNGNIPSTKAFTIQVSRKKHLGNIRKDAENEIKITKPTSTGSSGIDVARYEPLLRPPLEQQQQQQQQRQQQQQHQQIVPTSSNIRYQNPGPNQEQVNIQRSFIPTIKPQRATQNYQSTPVPQSQRLQTNSYGFYPNSFSNNNPYGSYQTQRSTNILCFGDSLTSGFYNHGRGKHPYSIRLNQLLNPGGSHHYHIVTRGVVGEMAHGSMAKRLPKVLNEGVHFDWVVILGGTNDVAHVKNFGDDEDFTRQLISVWSPKIVKDIEKLHETARTYGARTVLMTIPETAYELWPEFRSIRNMRLSVNAALRKYAPEVRDTTVLCDLAYKLPRSTLPNEMQKLYWNDHIHLNPVGYDKMAEIIQQCIQPYLT